MKTKFTWLGIVATILLGVSVFFIACDTDLNSVVKYRGQVVYINTTNPFPDLTVKVTNGKETHCQTQTDAGGAFELKVRVNEIDGNYYLLAGDSTCIPKKVALGGYGQAEVDLGVIEVEGPALPTVITTPLQSITADEAVLGGEVKTDGRLTVTARGICYGTKAYPTIADLHTIDGAGKGVFVSHLENLEHNTVYYARAYATNRMGTAYDTIQIKFTTEEGVPVVRTDTVINITAHSAKIRGYVDSDGGYKVTKRGTCWSTHHDPTVDDNCTNDGSGLNEFTSTLTNLSENTTYYVRTFASNSTATKYGEEKEFTTLDGLAAVRTDSIPKKAITATSFLIYATVLKDCDIPVTERGFCYATTQYPTIEGKHVSVGKGMGPFTTTISGLKYATTYYVRAYATNATATTYDSLEYVVTTLNGLPTVVTETTITDLGSVKATCGGEVTDDGTLSITGRGICYGTEPQLTIEDAHTSEGKGKGKFSSKLKNLKDSTLYYYRAYATTEAGTTYGKEYSFITKNGIPVVLLNQLSDTTANSITCKGNVTGDGGVSVTERGFCYSTSQYPTNTSDLVAIGDGKGEFSGSLNGLTVNTKYYVRAYAINSLGVGYSEQKSFMTKSGLPVVTTAAEPTATATTIKIGGNVTENGGYTVIDRGICYSTSNSEPTITEDKVSGGKGNGEFSVTITGLSANTTYHLRAYATNENGTVYGESVSIQTEDGSASVELGAIKDITALTASSTVTVTDVSGATLQSCGICWSTNPNPTIDDNKAVAGGKVLNTAYTCNMSNLTPNQTYYVRAYAITDVATSYGVSESFTTATGLPVLTTSSTTATSTKINSGGNITSDGGYAITARGVCYSTTNSVPTIEDEYTTSGIGIGTFTTVITNVSVSTTYYIRAYATNSIGTGYGEILSVTTGNGLPTVTTTVIGENVTETTAISGGKVTDDGGYTVTARGVCWSKSPYPTINADKTLDGSGKGFYSSTITEIDLTVANTYYVRAYATNKNGTSYGDQVIVSKENLDYKNLPAIEYGGYIYRLYRDLGGSMTWGAANSACENLVYAGYDDWRLPTSDELYVIMQKCENGWYDNSSQKWTISSSNSSAGYWTSTSCKDDSYFDIKYSHISYYFTKGNNDWYISSGCSDRYNERVRPVRKYKKTN